MREPGRQMRETETKTESPEEKTSWSCKQGFVWLGESSVGKGERGWVWM